MKRGERNGETGHQFSFTQQTRAIWPSAPSVLRELHTGPQVWNNQVYDEDELKKSVRSCLARHRVSRQTQTQEEQAIRDARRAHIPSLLEQTTLL